MGKKFRKAASIATVTAIAATAFSAVSPLQSEASSSAEGLVLKAEANKVPLIRASSVDYDANFTYPWALYNKAKADYSVAKVAVSKLSGRDKEIYNARLDAVKLCIDRTGSYIDALSSGNKVFFAQKRLDKNLEQTNMAEATKAYHALSYEIKKQAVVLYRVYGHSTRDAILKKFKLPAEAAKRKALYPVSIYIENMRFEAALQKKDMQSAYSYSQNIEKWLKQLIGKDELLNVLSKQYSDAIEKYPPEIKDVVLAKDVQFQVGSIELGGFAPFEFLDSAGHKWGMIPTKYGFKVKDDKGYFNEDGNLKEAYMDTGIPEAGQVKIQLIDAKNDKVVIEATVNVVNGDIK